VIEINEQKPTEVPNPDHIDDDDIDIMKSIAEKEWSNYSSKNENQIKTIKHNLQIELVVPGSDEHKHMFQDLTKIKKNILWVVIAANIAFYTIVVTMSSIKDFDVLQTNVFSLALLLLFGFVQIVQTTCMTLDSVKSLARRVSYL